MPKTIYILLIMLSVCMGAAYACAQDRGEVLFTDFLGGDVAEVIEAYGPPQSLERYFGPYISMKYPEQSILGRTYKLAFYITGAMVSGIQYNALEPKVRKIDGFPKQGFSGNMGLNRRTLLLKEGGPQFHSINLLANGQAFEELCYPMLLADGQQLEVCYSLAEDAVYIVGHWFYGESMKEAEMRAFVKDIDESFMGLLKDPVWALRDAVGPDDRNRWRYVRFAADDTYGLLLEVFGNFKEPFINFSFNVTDRRGRNHAVKREIAAFDQFFIKSWYREDQAFTTGGSLERLEAMKAASGPQ